MRKARLLVNGIEVALLEELNHGQYKVTYQDAYQGPPLSLTMPTKNHVYTFNQFPPFFEGLLPEGVMLEALLRKYKLDKTDYFSQLIKVGHDVVGAVSIEEME
jgi:serine/threonine-protein kinase HipA